MSKEMMVIALGFWIIIVRTLLGIPGEWQTVLLVLTGVLLAVIGFLLRGEALSRAQPRDRHPDRPASYTFVESTPSTSATHDQTKEGITSLN